MKKVPSKFRLFFKIIKYLPFIIGIFYTILYSVLLCGSPQCLNWYDFSKDVSWFSYTGLVFFIRDIGILSDIYYLLSPILLIIFLKVFKKEVFQFYLTLVLLIIISLIDKFWYGYWYPW